LSLWRTLLFFTSLRVLFVWSHNHSCLPLVFLVSFFGFYPPCLFFYPRSILSQGLRFSPLLPGTPQGCPPCFAPPFFLGFVPPPERQTTFPKTVSVPPFSGFFFTPFAVLFGFGARWWSLPYWGRYHSFFTPPLFPPGRFLGFFCFPSNSSRDGVFSVFFLVPVVRDF